MTDHDFEVRLRADLRELADEPAPATLRASVIAIPDEVPTSLGRRLTTGWRFPAMLRFAPLALAAAAVVIALVGIGLLVRSPDIGPPAATPSAPAASCAADPSPPIAAEGWTGPVRPSSATVIDMPTDPEDGTADSIADGIDSSEATVDIERVNVGSPTQPHWELRLAAAPPSPSRMPLNTVISYGLTFDTNGDGGADYVVGISNDAPHAGDLRVWVTNLATCQTSEQIGPPYGFPVEFAYPGERSPSMVFTFLGGSRPAGIDVETRFYAWASVDVDGEVIAWDYAPDASWLQPSRHRE